MGVARRTPAPRPPLCIDRVRLPINIRSSSRVNRFESSHRGVAVESTSAFLRIHSHRLRRSTRARSPSVASFRGLSVRPVRPFRPHRRRWSSPFLVSSSPRFLLLLLPLPLASFSSPGRARCRDIAIFILSFAFQQCERNIHRISPWPDSRATNRGYMARCDL